MFQPPTLIGLTLAAIVIANIVAMFFVYATDEGPGAALGNPSAETGQA